MPLKRDNLACKVSISEISKHADKIVLAAISYFLYKGKGKKKQFRHENLFRHIIIFLSITGLDLRDFLLSQSEWPTKMSRLYCHHKLVEEELLKLVVH